jgi:hypothetical protein
LGLKMKKTLFAAAMATVALAAASSASAAAVLSFGPMGYSPTPGYTLVDTFDAATGISGVQGIGNDYLLTTNHDGYGAPPANSNPYDTSYLSVLGGGAASISFAALTATPVKAFEFEWGSIDSYNTLVIHSNQGDEIITPGVSFPNLANGDQVAAGTNGLFRVVGAQGQIFSGMTLSSGSNSFEVDNLAVAAVPEPATWAMMLMGLAGLGAMLRFRRKETSAAACA